MSRILTPTISIDNEKITPTITIDNEIIPYPIDKDILYTPIFINFSNDEQIMKLGDLSFSLKRNEIVGMAYITESFIDNFINKDLEGKELTISYDNKNHCSFYVKSFEIIYVTNIYFTYKIEIHD